MNARLLIAAASLLLTSVFSTAFAGDKFVTIGTGGQKGVYYVAGQSICELVNRAPASQPPKELMDLPALILLGLIIILQRKRRDIHATGQAKA
jgi:hypothetical protein